MPKTDQYLSRSFVHPLFDRTIPMKDCGKRSYCGRCPDCLKALGKK
jgi:hypothetical protein